MKKWFILVLLTIILIFYFMMYSYGRIYYIAPLSYSDFAIAETTTSNSYYHFVDPYESEFETRKSNYILKIKNNLHSRPDLFISVNTIESNILTLSNLSMNFQAECVSFANEEDLNGNVNAILSFSRCSDQYKSNFNKSTIRFNVVDESGKILGTEEIEFTVHHNGYYMILDVL